MRTKNENDKPIKSLQKFFTKINFIVGVYINPNYVFMSLNIAVPMKEMEN